MTRKTPRRALIASILATLLAALAAAAVADASGATVYSCVKKKGGTTRIVTVKTKCKRSERRLSWSAAGLVGQRGASGAPGATGPTGPTGAGGAVAGFSAVNSSFVALSSETQLVSKTIPAGSYIVTAKTAIIAMSLATGWAAAECGLVDTPGPEYQKSGQSIDAGLFEGALFKGPSSSYGVGGGVPFASALSTTGQSTLTIVCAGGGGGLEPVSVAGGFSSITAVQTSHNG